MRFIPAIATLAAVTALPWLMNVSCLAGPDFYGTGDPLGHWFVATNVDRNGDGTVSPGP